ncbi:MAG: sigma-54-dependent Fis family transcriptional regulator, partial [Betaproteobacteria bacterium]|nr:sigma-54-dependent Fis family transcriptional regulator [Betaproteobacteria bacterium]
MVTKQPCTSPPRVTFMNAPNAGFDPQHRGFLIIDQEGKTRFASGIATNPRFATRIIEGWMLAERSDQRVFSISDQFGPLVAVAYRTPDATAIVVMMREPNDSLFEFAATVEFAGDILRHLLTNPYEALTVVDREGIVRYISPVHERFFGLPAGGGLGKHVTQVIENTRLHEVARNGRAEIGQLQVMKDTSRVVTRIPVQGSCGEVVGAIGQVMFKGPEQLQTLSAELSRLRSEVEYYRRELSSLRERSVGLDQLIGDGPAMRRLKQQILKVAPLDVPVLLVGESGTGKELVAQAIHQLSPRREEALVMINAAALPANLVESELFGYEAGAFTGAERKGRRGKVEQADRSSLFLD